MSETSLHTSLIQWYARPGDEIEVSLDDFVIDILRGNLLIEIQTRSFNKIRPKLERLLEDHPVHLVHPIAAEKWIVREDKSDPTRLARRKSPKHGRLEDIFRELIFIPSLILNNNFTLEVLMIEEEQRWVDNESGSWRRGGWSIADRKLLGVYNQYRFQTRQDFIELLPEDLPNPFSSKQLSDLAKIPRKVAQKMIYCLRHMGGLIVVDLPGPGKEKWYSIHRGQ